ncbi:alpha/beta hydrolase family protein [Paenibacillus sp. FSL M7-0420]|uniref:alpha/beta hydrolase family protein n=1 Tax=Paenibacillus sp. FSL M7-0420 TaxID=2921609 RepID=UPI0030FB3750
MSHETLTFEHFKLPLENGLYLEGEVRVPVGTAPKPVLLISHGFRGHKDWAFWPEVSGRIAGSGFYTVSFNFSRIAARDADGISPEEAAEAATLSSAALLIQGDQDRDALLLQHAGFREQAPQHRYLSIRGADHTFGTVDPYEGSTSALNEAVTSTIAFLQEKLA